MPNEVNLDAALRVLLDKQELHEVLVRYCRGVDRLDRELLESVYWPDAYDEHSTIFSGVASDFIPFVIKYQGGQYVTHQHAICNELFEVDGDVAWGESYLCATNRILENGQLYDFISGARHIDRFERRDGVWKIARRQVAVDWHRLEKVVERRHIPAIGSRSREDPVYRRD